MEISLEHIDDPRRPNTFRVAFHSATERCLLPYPCVTGLTFTNVLGSAAGEWRTRHVASEPMDDFVMSPEARIAFDLRANINAGSENGRWMIRLPAGTYGVRFDYRVDRETDWHDFLAKRSRFAAMTPIWNGAIQSNTVRFIVVDAGSR